jgi:chemotaxis protein methyltransferase CheR
MGQPVSALSLRELINHISELISEVSGNVLGEDQRSMVETRVQKRIMDLGLETPDSYFHFLTQNKSSETEYLVSLLTTHHTFFFREFIHFEKLLEVLPAIVEKVKARGDNEIRLWSAACSRGQEVYSLGSFLEFHLKDYPGMKYKILGTDIDPQSVSVGQNGVYLYKEVKSIPQTYLSGNWRKGKGDIAHFAKVKDHVKANCQFKVFNLIDGDYSGIPKCDVIFCRNVFIYFKPESISQIVPKMKDLLFDGGYLVTGLSESLNLVDIPKKSIGPSFYTFTLDEDKISDSELLNAPTLALPVSNSNKPLRVLAVDDSKSVLKLLTRIFKDDPQFELVGTAENGKEAEDFLQKNHVDVMTLDIHMPEMDGVEYLRKNYHSTHPHVVIVSSASREDTRYAQECFKNGASDFVEKPSLQNLKEKADEIKLKLKLAAKAPRAITSKNRDEIVNDFTIRNCREKARVFYFSLSQMSKVEFSLNELKGKQPPVLLFGDGPSIGVDIIKSKLNLKGLEVIEYRNGDSLFENKVYICDLESDFENLMRGSQFKRISMSVFGRATDKLANLIFNTSDAQILLEEGTEDTELGQVASDIFPFTSFSHVGSEYLAKD